MTDCSFALLEQRVLIAKQKKDSEALESWQAELQEVSSIDHECEEWCGVATAIALRLKSSDNAIEVVQNLAPSELEPHANDDVSDQVNSASYCCCQRLA